MNPLYVSILIGFAAILGVSQIVFKKAVVVSWAETPQFLPAMFRLLVTPYFWIAIFLYAALGGVWFWVLTKVPISRAYPFVVLSFVVVAVLERMAFNEPVTLNLALGIGLILLGLGFIAS